MGGEKHKYTEKKTREEQFSKVAHALEQTDVGSNPSSATYE